MGALKKAIMKLLDAVLVVHMLLAVVAPWGWYICASGHKDNWIAFCLLASGNVFFRYGIVGGGLSARRKSG